MKRLAMARRSRIPTYREGKRREDSAVHLQHLMNGMKRMDDSLRELKHQQLHMTLTLNHQHRLLNLLCANQKQIAQGLMQHRVSPLEPFARSDITSA